MAQNMIRNLLIFLILLLAMPFNVVAMEDDPPTITVLASASMTNVLTELVRLYSIKEGISVTAAYKGPDELASDIENGEVADIYISDHPIRMRDLKRQGMLDVFSFTTLATNRLVLAASKDNLIVNKHDENSSLADILKDVNVTTNLVIGDPSSTPIGIVTQRALEKILVWEHVEPFTIKTSNTMKALYLIDKGEKAGIVYYTDAKSNPNIRIIAEVPADLHTTIVYQAAVVAGENMPLARKFLDFLKSDTARKIFEKYGFSVI